MEDLTAGLSNRTSYNDENIFCIYVAAIKHMWLPNTWNGTSEDEELNFNFVEF